VAEALRSAISSAYLAIFHSAQGQAEPQGLQDLHLTEMASWREGDRTRNVHLGSARKMDAAAARQKARERKTSTQFRIYL
jgi:hypothetical protein